MNSNCLNVGRTLHCAIFLLMLMSAPRVWAVNFASGVTLDTNTHTTDYRAYSAGDIDNNGNVDLVGEAATGVLSMTKDLTDTPVYEVQSHIAAEANNFYASTLADLDGDGDLDLITAGPNGSTTSPNNIYYWDAVTNNRYEKAGSTYTLTGNTTFFYGTGVIAGDFNNDGKKDVLWLGFDKAYLGINSTTVADNIQFSSITDTGLAIDNNTLGNFSAATADFNQDGNLDFIVTGNSFISGNWGGYYQIGYGDGSGGFTLSTLSNSGDGYQPTAIAVGDFNNDGKDDFVLTRSIFPNDGQLIVYLRNNLNNGFDATTLATSSIATLKGLAVDDLNYDGYEDIVVQSNSGLDLDVYLNLQDGTFLSAPDVSVNIGLKEQFFLTDVNNDGLLDILTVGHNLVNYFSQTADNLLVNPSGESGDFTGWTKVDGGSGWGISAPHGGYYGFISSYDWGTLSQEIDLIGKGYDPDYLDSAPDINISDYIIGTTHNYADSYQLIVELRDASHSVIATYDTGVQTANSSWTHLTHTFSGYGSDVRYIYFQRGGIDAEYWLGQYGGIFDNASVIVGMGSIYDLSYSAGANGSLTGNASQTVNTGEDGTAITPVPNSGYVFVDWSDGSTLNPRIDTELMSNYSATANFGLQPSPVTSFSAIASGDDVNLTWTNPPDLNFDSVTIRRSTSGFPTTASSDTLVTQNNTGTNFSDTGLSDGTYYYSIFVKNDVGSFSVATTDSVIVDTILPAAPSNFSAVAVESTVNLDWTNPVDVDFESITIRRSTTSFPSTPTDGMLVTQNNSGTNISDTGLVNGTYYYSIFAYDIVGNISSSAVAIATVDVAVTTVTSSSGGGSSFFGKSASSGGGISSTTNNITDIAETTIATKDLVNGGTEEPFIDEIGHWSHDFVLQLYYLKVVQGREPGKFIPEGNLTRAEAVKIGLLAYGYSLDVQTPAGFSDLDPNAWYVPYLKKAKQEGFISGTTFRPDDAITRIDALVMFLKMAKKQGVAPVTPFKDISPQGGFASDVNYAYAQGVIQGRSADRFEPFGTITRAETSKMVLLIKEI